MAPDDPARQIADLLSAPLEEILVALGSGIGRSQTALDRHSIELQERIDSDPDLAHYGLEATWYQIPSTELELKVSVAMQEHREEQSAAAAGPLSQKGLPRLWIQPVNARFQNQFAYDVNAASTVKLTIVPVPPTGAAASATSSMTRTEALEQVADRLERAGDAFAGRVSVNYNPAARAWYVVQTIERDGEPQLIASAKVDDETGQVTDLGKGGG
jgi:hypothetical protein